MPANLPPKIISQTRDFCFDHPEFEFGQWQKTTDIVNFIRGTFGVNTSTASQYAARFVTRGVAKQDFEKRLQGQEWRWAPPKEPTP